MDEVTGFDRFESVPDTPGDNVRIAGPKENLRLDAHRPLVTVVQNQLHGSAHDIQELIAVRMDLTIVRSRPLEIGDRSDRVSIDPPGRSGRADVMIIDQSRPMLATFPSKWTGDGFGTAVMCTDCPTGRRTATECACRPS